MQLLLAMYVVLLNYMESVAALFVARTSGCLAVGIEGIPHYLGSLTPGKGISRPEISAIQCIARLTYSTTVVPTHHSRPVHKQPLHINVEC